MLDVYFPTTDARELIFRRYIQPEKDHKMILANWAGTSPPASASHRPERPTDPGIKVLVQTF